MNISKHVLACPSLKTCEGRLKRGKVFFMLVALFFMPAALSWGETLPQIIQRFGDRYSSISAISADFTQEFTSKSGDAPQRSDGRVWFKKPGRMKWVYTGPAKDELVSNGARIWFYQPDLKQAVERPFDPSQNLGGDFLTGMGNLSRDFSVRLAVDGPFTWTLELSPRMPSPNIMRLFIEINRGDTLINRSIVEDNFGNTTSISYRNIRLNEAISDSFFTFTPPKGVKIVR